MKEITIKKCELVYLIKKKLLIVYFIIDTYFIFFILRKNLPIIFKNMLITDYLKNKALIKISKLSLEDKGKGKSKTINLIDCYMGYLVR